MAKQAAERVSIRLGDFTGGSFGPPVGGTYRLEHEVCIWNYGGNGPETLAVRVTFNPCSDAGADLDEAKPLVVHYSAGDSKKFGPSDDGKGFVALGASKSLGSGSNFFIFLEHLINSGFPESLYDNDMSVFDGLIAVTQDIPEPKRNLPTSNLMGGEPKVQRDRTISVVSEIKGYVGDNSDVVAAYGGKKGKPAAKTTAAAPARAATPAKKTPPPEDNGEGSLLGKYLATALDGQASVSKTNTRVLLFRAMNADKVDAATRDAAMKEFNDENVLGGVLAGIGDGFAVDGTNIVAI